MNAQDNRYLNIVLKDNSCVSYEIDNNSAYITFNDSCMRVNGIDFFLNNIVKYYVSEEDDVVSGIRNINLSRNKIVGNYLYITTPLKGTVKLYDMGGKCIMTERTDSSYSVIDLSTIQRGTYIVRINNESFKFTKK